MMNVEYIVSDVPCDGSKGRRTEWRWTPAYIHRRTPWWWGAVGSRSELVSARSPARLRCLRHADVTVRRPGNHRAQSPTSNDLATSRPTSVLLFLLLSATYLQCQHHQQR